MAFERIDFPNQNMCGKKQDRHPHLHVRVLLDVGARESGSRSAIGVLGPNSLWFQIFANFQMTILASTSFAYILPNLLNVARMVIIIPKSLVTKFPTSQTAYDQILTSWACEAEERYRMQSPRASYSTFWTCTVHSRKGTSAEFFFRCMPLFFPISVSSTG